MFDNVGFPVHPLFHLPPLEWRHMAATASQITDNSTDQQHVQASAKENIKWSHHWLFVRGTTGDRWIPLTKGRWCGKRFHVMTSSGTDFSNVYGTGPWRVMFFSWSVPNHYPNQCRLITNWTLQNKSSKFHNFNQNTAIVIKNVFKYDCKI